MNGKLSYCSDGRSSLTFVTISQIFEPPPTGEMFLFSAASPNGCDTHQTVALDIVLRPKSTPIHELERYMRCKDCSQVRGYPYKRSHLVALRTTKISANDPQSTWWPGER